MKATLLFCGFLLGITTAPAVVHYVDLNSTNPVPPFAGWSTAAKAIQDAVDTSANGDTVLVNDGIYLTGGRMWYDSGSNRVTVTNSLILRSVNGPDLTTIQGERGPGSPAVRCVLLSAKAALLGFTLANGGAGTGNYIQGGGVLCDYSSGGSVISNCTFVGNRASSGGGAYGGILVNCMFRSNTADWWGGGAASSILLDCSLLNNHSGHYGGGAAICTLANCLVAGNSAKGLGGGFFDDTFSKHYVDNCTIVSNTATSEGGGVEGGLCRNCIVYYNDAPMNPNALPLGASNCCTIPAQPGRGNITNAPLFVNPSVGDYRLRADSPCINAGDSSCVTNSIDLDGNPRISGGTVDIGAYEFQNPASSISYAWLHRFGLATDGSADSRDPDGDGMNNWQEWICGTDPTDARSVLRLLPPLLDSSGVTIRWQSTSNRTYFVERASSLAEPAAFMPIATNLPGLADTMSLVDTNSTGAGPTFYRVQVQP